MALTPDEIKKIAEEARSQALSEDTEKKVDVELRTKAMSYSKAEIKAIQGYLKAANVKVTKEQAIIIQEAIYADKMEYLASQSTTAKLNEQLDGWN